MKNKLFLTSMLVMLVVPPAFADTDTATTLGLNADNSGQIGSDSTAENCYGNALTFENTEATSGTVIYTANWTPQQCTITLNTDDYDATTNTTGRGGNNSTYPSTLYTTYGEGAYLDPARTSQYLMTYNPQSHPLSVAPVGKGVTLTLNANVPASYAGTAPSNSTVNGTLVFNGFWVDTTTSSASNQYIGATKYITRYGDAAAAGLYESTQDPQTGEALCPDTTWHAQYTCGNVTYSNLADLDSHTFAGWYTGQTGGTQVTSPYCIDQDETIYAHWTPKQFTLTYNPGTCSGNGSTDTLTFNESYDIKSITQAGVSVPAGYTFQGWTTSSAATSAGTWQTTTSSTPTDSCNSSNGCSDLGPWQRAEGLTLYAVCTGNGANILYNCGTANGATISGPSVSSASVNIGADYALEGSNNCSAPGYEFIGWSCPNLGGTPDTPAVAGQQSTLYSGGWDSTDYGETFTYTGGNITCTAQWRSNQINLEWYLDDDNTESYDDNPQSCNFGVANDIPLTVPTKPGYTFDGWTVTGWTE